MLFAGLLDSGNIINIISGETQSILCFPFLLIWIGFIWIFDHCVCRTAGYIGASTFRADRSMNGHGGGNDFSIVLWSFGICIGYMLPLMGAHCISGCTRSNVGGWFVGNIFVGSICIFPVFTGLAFFRGAGRFVESAYLSSEFWYYKIIIIGICISVYACICGYIHEDASFLQVIGVS